MTSVATTGAAAPLQILVPQFLCFALNNSLNNVEAPVDVGPDLGKVERDLKKRNKQLGLKVEELTRTLDAATQQNLKLQRQIYALHNNLSRAEQELVKIKSSLHLPGNGEDANIVHTIGQLYDDRDTCRANLYETEEQLIEITDNYNQTQNKLIEREKDLMEVSTKYNFTKEKLNVTEEELNDVSTKYEITKDQLNVTEIKLNDTEHQLNETTVKFGYTDDIVDVLVEDRSLLLTEAVAMGNSSLIVPLVRLGTPVTGRDQFGYIALDWASLGGDGFVTQLLIEGGANVSAQLPTYNDFPLHVAARAGFSDVVRALLDAHADKEAKNADGNTALHEASYYGHEDAVKILLDAGANVEAKNGEGNTPLLFAAQKGHLPVVKLLVQRGANEAVRNQEGRTPQEEAQRRGKQNVETWLSKRI